MPLGPATWTCWVLPLGPGHLLPARRQDTLPTCPPPAAGLLARLSHTCSKFAPRLNPQPGLPFEEFLRKQTVWMLWHCYVVPCSASQMVSDLPVSTGLQPSGGDCRRSEVVNNERNDPSPLTQLNPHILPSPLPILFNMGFPCDSKVSEINRKRKCLAKMPVLETLTHLYIYI